MDLDTKIIAVFCRIDDALKHLFQGQRLRRSGPKALLSDAEVLTMETVGEFLGLNRDTALYRYFRQHYSHFFPAMAQVCRTTFVGQAANLWRVKEQVWQILLGSIRYDPALTIVDSSGQLSPASMPLRQSPSLSAVPGGSCFRQG